MPSIPHCHLSQNSSTFHDLTGFLLPNIFLLIEIRLTLVSLTTTPLLPPDLDQYYNAALIHSFIHSGHFYSAAPNRLLLRSATDTARILCRSFTPKRHRQLRVKNLPKVPT